MVFLEFFLLFVVAPTVFAFTRHRFPAIPALWLIAAYCLFVLLRDPRFDRRHLWDVAALSHSMVSILLLFAIVATAGTVLVLWRWPQIVLGLPKSNPRLWLLIMFLYPVLSVYPQGIIYRAFVFERYRELFTNPWSMVVASAIVFSYVHVVFRNPLAVTLTFFGGLLFAWRYQQTGSLFTSSAEHALYGCAIFTIGLGRSFYHGAVRR